jgi:glycosyltransferase involved in cell wall biosynthesis
MKILYLITEGDLGGAQKYVLDLAQNFQGIIVTGPEGNWLERECKALGLSYVRINHLWRKINPIIDFLALIEIFSLIKKIKPDIVHVNSSKAGILGSIAGKMAGAKIVFTAHGLVFNEPRAASVNRFFTYIEKFASIFRDKIITVSDFDKKTALAYKITSPGKISVVYHGLGQTKFLDQAQARRELKLPQDKLIVGTIANFFYTKGLDILIGAASDFEAEIVYAVIGDGPEHNHLEQLIKKSNLSNKFGLLGQIPDATKFLKAFDIFVLPSRKEGLPYVLLEALQARVPIIATAVGGVPEILGQNGYLIPPFNQGILSLMIRKLADDAGLRQIKEEEISKQLSYFTHEKMIAETKNIYEWIK